MIDLVMTYLDGNPANGSLDGDTHGAGLPTPPLSSEALSSEALSSEALSSEAWQALRMAVARLAVDLVAGRDGLASLLRRGLLDFPYNSKSVVLDIGFSSSIPPAIRKAVRLRARGVCEWPGCRRTAAFCDVHHLVHKADGGETSLSNCVLLCQYHHDVCIHRRGWRLVLHPDATTTAYGPDGQVLCSHGPPDGSRPLGRDPARAGPPGDDPSPEA
jgi:hypothetical protein